jgi:DNA-binding transcriptional LysR family regulator
VPGVTLTKWTRVWAERFPRRRLATVEVGAAEQVDVLRAGTVDACFVREQAPAEDLHVIPLYAEVAVVVARKDHPIAVVDEVALAELADELVLDEAEYADAIDLVAGGAGVLVVPQSVARSYSRRDLVHRPVSDAPPTQISLAWLRRHDSELIQEFVGVVRGRTQNSSRSEQDRARRAEPPVPRRPRRR